MNKSRRSKKNREYLSSAKIGEVDVSRLLIEITEPTQEQTTPEVFVNDETPPIRFAANAREQMELGLDSNLVQKRDSDSASEKASIEFVEQETVVLSELDSAGVLAAKVEEIDQIENAQIETVTQKTNVFKSLDSATNNRATESNGNKSITLADSMNTLVGQRLRAAREHLGWTREEVASRIRLPAHVIEQLEAEQFEKLGAPIFVRGFLQSYAKALDLPLVVVQSAMEKLHAPVPDLVASRQISTSQHMWQRYRHRLSWVLLTTVLVGPLIWFNFSQRKSVDPPRLEALDISTEQNTKPNINKIVVAAGAVSGAPAESANSTQTISTSVESETNASVPTGNSELGLQQPMMAGLVLAQSAQLPVNEIELSISDDCWVDVQDRFGSRLEYGVVKAGSVLRYPLDTVANFSIGNLAGAKMRINGRDISLKSYSNSNVVHLKADELRLAAQ